MTTEMIQQKPFEPRIEMIDGRPIIIKDDRGCYENLESFLKKPTRIRLNETLKNFNSFVEVCATRLGKEDAAIYTRTLDRDKYNDFRFEAIAKDCRNDNPEWRDDFVYRFDGLFTKHTRDWLKFDEEGMDQSDFALFIDKHLNDIRCREEDRKLYPTQMELYNFVSTLQDSKSDRFSRKVNIQNGDVSVSLERESDDGTKQQLKLFERFPIVLQIYEGFPEFQVEAKLRFRIRDGQVYFFYDIQGLEEMFIAARDWAVNELKEKTGLPVYI